MNSTKKTHYINIYNKNKRPISANVITSANYTDHTWKRERMNTKPTGKQHTMYSSASDTTEQALSSLMADLQLIMKVH